jgi:hypothetical protein
MVNLDRNRNHPALNCSQGLFRDLLRCCFRLLMLVLLLLRRVCFSLDLSLCYPENEHFNFVLIYLMNKKMSKKWIFCFRFAFYAYIQVIDSSQLQRFLQQQVIQIIAVTA